MRIALSYLFIVFTMLFLNSCQQNNKVISEPSEKPAFIPETAEMMNSIQRYHLKLWFAGQNEHWELADFQLHELEEVFETMELFKADKDYIPLLPMIYPPIENLEETIKSGDKNRFEEGFNQLTNTCNTCHKSTGHPYITIKIPETNPYSNQSFVPQADE